VKSSAAFPVRLQYTKHGKVRWISHRDVARALERAFRIAELPLAFTEGFSPRPKVSFGLALSTGHESDGEYLDLVLAEEYDLDVVAPRLTEALPTGLAVTAVVPLVERAPALQEAVTAVEWSVEAGTLAGAPAPEQLLRQAVDSALALESLPALRRRKGREVIDDVRPMIRRLEVTGGHHVEMELSTQPRGAKPGDVLAAIAQAVGAPDGLTDLRALRTYQWIERDGARLSPLSADTRQRVLEACAS
jgi:radical SAM-linked protein